jgi:hypothetical protein
LVAKAKGIVDLVLTNGSLLSLYDVLYVPQLTHNLISVDALQAMDVGVNFPPDTEGGGCTLLRGKTVLEYLPRKTGLYSVGGGSGQPPVVEAMYTAPARAESVSIDKELQAGTDHNECAMPALTLDEMHHRLGHASQQKLLHMVDHEQLEGVTIKGPRSLNNCFGCAMGKHKRHIMKTDQDKPATKKLDLIHMDLMGPFRKKTRGGHQWILSIIDDSTRYCWVHLLKSKKSQEVFAIIKEWVMQVERESEVKMFRIRSDGGKEFKNKLMRELCVQNGYTQEFTNTESSQQNEVSERHNWTLMSTMRSLLASSNMSEYWWGEAIKAACYMRNRSSHSSLVHKISPYQA